MWQNKNLLGGWVGIIQTALMGEPTAWILPPFSKVLLVPSRMWETLHNFRLHLEPLLNFEVDYQNKR